MNRYRAVPLWDTRCSSRSSNEVVPHEDKDGTQDDWEFIEHNRRELEKVQLFWRKFHSQVFECVLEGPSVKLLSCSKVI